LRSKIATDEERHAADIQQRQSKCQSELQRVRSEAVGDLERLKASQQEV